VIAIISYIMVYQPFTGKAKFIVFETALKNNHINKYEECVCGIYKNQKGFSNRNQHKYI